MHPSRIPKNPTKIEGKSGYLDLDNALKHYRESIRLEEASGNVYGASQTRVNAALHLFGANRLPDAREYARAALRGDETYGDSAADMIAQSQQLLAAIEQAIREQPS